MLHRSHNGEQQKQAVYDAKEAGFADINIDLIYGLPRQSLDDKRNLAVVEELPINHNFYLYGLQVESGDLFISFSTKNLILF